MDSNKSIFQSAKSFLSGTLISRATGVFRDISLAYAFGTSPKIAALMLAYRFSNFFRRLLGEGSMQAAFIPQFESLKKECPQRATRFFKDLKKLLSFALLAIMIFSIAILILAYSLLSNESTSLSKEVIFLTALLMPSIFFICMYGLNCSLLQCEQNYFIPGVAPVAFNLVWISGVLCVMNFPVEQAVCYLAGFIVLAYMAQWLMTLPKTKKLASRYPKLDDKKFSFISSDVKQLFNPLLMGIVGVASTQINSTIDPLFAIYANQSGPAYLWYSIRLELLPLGLFGLALSNALLPPLSRAIQNGNILQYTNFLAMAIRKTIVFMAPITFAYFVAGHTCINLLFGRGDFDVHSIISTTKCLWAYTLGLIPSSLILMIAPGFYALKNYRTPMILTFLSVVINISLNSFFVFYLDMSAAAVALATSFSAWLNFIFLINALKNHIGNLLIKTHLKIVGITLLASCMGVVLVAFFEFMFFNQISALEIFRGNIPQMPRNLFDQIMYFIVQALAFAIPIVPLWLYELNLFSGVHKEVVVD